MLESGNWVSLGYVGYDRKQRKYGHIVRLPRCRISRSANIREVQEMERFGDSPTAVRKAQNHSEHFTRNVVTDSGAKRKLHLRLLFQINNQRVL